MRQKAQTFIGQPGQLDPVGQWKRERKGGKGSKRKREERERREGERRGERERGEGKEIIC